VCPSALLCLFCSRFIKKDQVVCTCGYQRLSTHHIIFNGNFIASKQPLKCSQSSVNLVNLIRGCVPKKIIIFDNEMHSGEMDSKFFQVLHKNSLKIHSLAKLQTFQLDRSTSFWTLLVSTIARSSAFPLFIASSTTEEGSKHFRLVDKKKNTKTALCPMRL
jgi:hypothetical protein